MTLSTAVFGLAILVTATVAPPVAAAFLVHRDSSVAFWAPERIRWIWATVATLWLLSPILKLARGCTFAELDLVVSALGFVAAVAAGFFHRPHAS